MPMLPPNRNNDLFKASELSIGRTDECWLGKPVGKPHGIYNSHENDLAVNGSVIGRTTATTTNRTAFRAYDPYKIKSTPYTELNKLMEKFSVTMPKDLWEDLEVGVDSSNTGYHPMFGSNLYSQIFKNLFVLLILFFCVVNSLHAADKTYGSLKVKNVVRVYDVGQS